MMYIQHFLERVDNTAPWSTQTLCHAVSIAPNILECALCGAAGDCDCRTLLALALVKSVTIISITRVGPSFTLRAHGSGVRGRM